MRQPPRRCAQAFAQLKAWQPNGDHRMSKTTRSKPDQITLTLAQRYLNILSESDLREVYDSSPAISGLFVSGLTTSFGSAKHRIMVVGMETKAWRNESCPFRRGDIPTIDAVVES